MRISIALTLALFACGESNKVPTNPFLPPAGSSPEGESATIELEGGEMVVKGPGGRGYRMNVPGSRAMPEGMRMTVGEGQEPPDGFPLPVMPGATVSVSQKLTMPGQGTMVTVALETSEPVEKVAAFYRAELKKKGIEPFENTMQNPETEMVMLGGEGEIGQLNASIVRAKGEDKTVVSIGWQQRE